MSIRVSPQSRTVAFVIHIISGLLISAFLISCDSGSSSSKDHEPANTRYVKPGSHTACTSKSDIEQAAQFAYEKDTKAFWDLYREGRCFDLKPDDTVYLEDSTFSGLVKIRPKGSVTTVWTTREAVTTEKPKDGPPTGAMPDTPQVGLGSTVAELERAWNKGYRWSSDICVRVGSSEESSIGYYTYQNFGDPPRVGEIDSGSRGLFGAAKGQPPTKDQFFTSITHLMPKDSRLISAYRSKNPSLSLEEDFVFESLWLKNLPGAHQASAYSFNPIYKTQAPVGTFTLCVHYDPAHPDLISMFQLAIAIPNMDTMTKIPLNSTPFRTTANKVQNPDPIKRAIPQKPSAPTR